MRLLFYLLDTSYEVRDNKPVILIWGLTDGGNTVLILDDTFRPYFYVLPDNGVDLEALATRVRTLSKPPSPITKVEVVERRYYGKPVRVLRVETVIPEFVREYREKVRKIEGVRDVLEADIRFAMRYIIDRSAIPCTWYEAEVEEVEGERRYRARVYRLLSDLKRVERDLPPNMKVMAFDIEVYNPAGSPRPKHDPVIIIATYDGREVKQFLAEGSRNSIRDAGAIRSFISYVKELDPDIIVGYNSNGFDWPYLLERAKINSVRLDVGRVKGAEPRSSAYGHISVPGRLNVDLYDFAQEIGEVKIKSLEEVADYLGVMKKNERVLIPWYRLYEYWDDDKKREILLKYSRDDVIATYGLSEKFLPFAIQLSALTGLPLDQVGAASVGYRLEWYLMREAFRFGELVPNRVERRAESYKGAIVLEPKKGVHENIAVLDFSSMYPNLMIKYNIGPDTFVEGECGEDECYVIPEVGYKFRKEPPGFFKNVLTTLLRLRKQVKSEMRKYPPDSPMYRLLDERQKALKVLANATYGYMGWSGARWYFRQGAEAVTALGRTTIRRAIEIAKSLGLEVIYGDTDSLFVKYDKEKVKEFIRRVEEELELEIKIDKIYKRVFFTEAKKRYVGLLEDGRVDIVGFEAVRGDWTEVAKEVQEEVAKIVLSKGEVDEAINYVRKVIADLRAGKIDITKLVIWKTLTRPINQYTTEPPHVAAAKKLMKAGYRVEVGDKIGYVVVKGAGKIADKAVPYIMADPRDIDVEYYVKHQIIPAALRILKYFGVSEKALEGVGKARKTLLDFFGKR